MDKDFILDENGLISDDDPIYEKLDEWHENDEYDNILEAIYAIPREMWSNKLWFRVISALNNKKEFDKSREELDKILERCEAPLDKGSAYYMLGYIYFMQDKEIKALDCYRCAMKEDPEKDLQSECEECQKYIDEGFSKLDEEINDIVKLIDSYLNDVPKKDKIKPTENEFAITIGLVPSLRTFINRCIGIDDIFEKYDEDEKKVVREWFLKKCNVKDIKTLTAAYNSQLSTNGKYKDIVAYISGKPNFDINDFDSDTRLVWDSCMRFCEKMINKTPDGGLIAWDISEKMGILRHAYACDIITDSEYILAVMELTDEIKKEYSSWKEYLTGYIFGAGMFMFFSNELNISQTVEFMCNITTIILSSAISQYKWVDGLRRTIKFEE